jgi:glycolate oxidase iron-sulfur subunit
MDTPNASVPHTGIPSVAPALTQTLGFDRHHPPDPEVIADCVHCGFCLPTCPTYVLWGEEMDSPRGRIALMKLASEGEIGLDASFTRHMDQCLGCMACVTACPSGVRYDQLIEATRPQIERNAPRPPADHAFRAMLFALFPHPGRMRALAPLLWAYQRLGLRRLARTPLARRLLPQRLLGMERVMPPVRLDVLRAQLPLRTSPTGTPRLHVGMLTGCVQRVFFADVNAATARVLAAEGCEVVTPTEQGCCGALHIHGGRDTEGLAYARRLIDTFARWGVDRVVVNAAGCGSNLKAYGHLLRDDPVYADRATAFAGSVRDVMELLAELEPRAARQPLALRVAYHDACHLGHAQGIRRQPRAVLRTIPDLDVAEIAEADLCCGSAGIFNLLEPETAATLGERKARHVLASGAACVATGNPGCLLQLQAALRAVGQPLPAVHPVELLDASIRGLPVSELLARRGGWAAAPPAEG